MSGHSSACIAPGRELKKVRPVAFVIVLLAIAYGMLQGLVPLRSAVKIGADEDFELSKATLCLHGYHLYTQIWDDQPPLDTFLITGILRHCSPSVLGPRLLTVFSTVVLLGCLFCLIHRLYGLLAAWITIVFLVASPGFLELSSSCMQEIPALAPVIAALLILSVSIPSAGFFAEVGAGIVFGLALQMKLIGLAYTPLVLLLIWLRNRACAGAIRRSGFSLLVFFGTVACSFAVLNCLTGNSLLLQFKQAWGAHFAQAHSSDYGSPAEHTFDWGIMLRNWDTTAPALFGAILLMGNVRPRPEKVVPLLWLVLTFLVFSLHRPWWAYYYIHNAIPLSICAGIGVAELWKSALKRKSLVWSTTLGIFCVCILTWIGSRIYLEEKALESSPRLSNCLVLNEIKRFKPYTTFLFTDRPIYSFHAGIPMPPHLAVISLKRFWSGAITSQGITDELSKVKPGLILLANDNSEVPFESFLTQEYRLVYGDAENRLYAHQSISRKPGVPTVGSPP